MSATQWIFIEPNDVLMFRDAKPFTAQQSFAARSMFPPTPQTLQGAMRTAALEATGIDIVQYANGGAAPEIYARFGKPPSRDNTVVADLGNFRMNGPYVGRRTKTGIERLFKVPLDVLQEKTSSQLQLLTPQNSKTFQSDLDDQFGNWQPLNVQATAPQEVGLEEAEGWLTEPQFVAYLENRKFGKAIPDDAIFVRDERVGLGLDYGRRANARSQFYHAQFVRLCTDVGLLVEISANTFASTSVTGMMKLGGEGRLAHYESVSYTPTLPMPTTGNLKLVLLTPAYFEDGWQPKSSNWSRWVGNGSLISVALGKPQYISGWDVANNRPKPLRHYVPAGSVYYFENAAITRIPFTETPDGDLDHGALGFGAFAIGAW